MDVDFSMDEAGITVFFGRSGAGKTTLVNMIAGLVSPDEGNYLLQGENFLRLIREDLHSSRAEGAGLCLSAASSLHHMSCATTCSLRLVSAAEKFNKAFMRG